MGEKAKGPQRTTSKPRAFQKWFTEQISLGRFEVGSRTSIDELQKVSGFAKSSVKLAIRDFVDSGVLLAIPGHGIVIKSRPAPPAVFSAQHVVFIARPISIEPSFELFERMRNAFEGLLPPLGSSRVGFDFLPLPTGLDFAMASNLRNLVSRCDAAVVGGVRTERERGFLQKLFAETPIPVVLLGSDDQIAREQYLVRSDEAEGCARLVQALVDKLEDLAGLDGEERQHPQFILLADDPMGRNRIRIEGCEQKLEELVRSGGKPFSWLPKFLWHPGDSKIRSAQDDQYLPALKGKTAGRYMTLRILDQLEIREGDNKAPAPSEHDRPIMPKAVLLAMTAELGEGVAEACVLRNVKVPGQVLIASTAGSFQRFGSFMSRSEPDSLAIAEAAAQALYSALRSPRSLTSAAPVICASKLHLRRSSRHVLDAVWRHAPSLLIKSVGDGQIRYRYGNPVFEHLSGRPFSAIKGSTAIEVWGYDAGKSIEEYDKIAAGLSADTDGKRYPRPILTATWLPSLKAKECRLTLRFPIDFRGRRHENGMLLGSLGFDFEILDDVQNVGGLHERDIRLVRLPHYESDSILEHPDEELLDAFFWSIPATVSVRTEMMVFYMNPSYARVFFGEEFCEKRSHRADGTIAEYYRKLQRDGKNEVIGVGIHRLVRDTMFKSEKLPATPELIGDRWVIRFRIADNPEGGGESSVGFDALSINHLLAKLAGVNTRQPFGGIYVELAQHPFKGYAIR